MGRSDGPQGGRNDAITSRVRARIAALPDSLTVPLAISLALHGVAAAVLAWLLSGGGGTILQVEKPALRATLTTPAQRFVVPEQTPPPPPAQKAQPLPTPARPAALPVPLKRSVAAPLKGTPGGQVTINLVDSPEPLEPALEAVLRQSYPGAAPATPEFEAMPVAIYPKAALADQRNVHLRVLVIMHEDGRVELAAGSLHDPLFEPSVRDALARARVRPAAEQGRPAVAWAFLLFSYEFVGER